MPSKLRPAPSVPPQVLPPAPPVPPATAPAWRAGELAAAPAPSGDDQADADRRSRAHVDWLLARPAAGAHGSLGRGRGKLDWRSEVMFHPIGPAGFEAAGGAPMAAVMCTSYQLEGADPASRPVCFVFNGGPGSASIWLHFGAAGPKRVAVPDDGTMPQAPFQLVDNPDSWFEHFDLVFIDPPHTGWSVAADAKARERLLSVDGDAAGFVEVIRHWLTRHRRWASPVYLAGESYGTTRGAAIADLLADAGVPLAGLVLVSLATDLQTLRFTHANLLPHRLFLPAFAAVSQYHGLVKGTPEQAWTAAAEFVSEYATALDAGARLDGGRRARVARRLGELTGLPAVLWESKNLRVTDGDYFTEALRPRGLQVGRLDARATAPLSARQARAFEFDPGIEAIAGPYTMLAMDAYQRLLGMEALDRPYEVLSEVAFRAWKWQRRMPGSEVDAPGFTTTSPDLARVLRRLPHLRVMVASGRYDLGTPWTATEWSLAQLDAPADVLARVTHHVYEAGHMMYTRGADLAKLKRDLAAWLPVGGKPAAEVAGRAR